MRKTLLRPYRLASLVAAVALLVSLGFAGYAAWSSIRRLDPLQRHMAHIQSLQDSSLEIQGLLIRHVESRSPPAAAEIDRVSRRLKATLDAGGQLHADTPAKLAEARRFLDAENGNPQVGLLAALSVVRGVLGEENKLQRAAILTAKRAAHAELLYAAIAITLVPVTAFLTLAYIRHRSLPSLDLLARMLENVGNQRFERLPEPGAGEPFAGLFARYNAMAGKLRAALEQSTREQEALETRVKAVSEALLRQQVKLEEGARLAALGEFSARVAHELRNPLSGITFALRNLESEVVDPDQRDRLDLVVDEIDRMTRLLNALLEKAPGKPEPPTTVNLRTLATDIAELFRYQLPAGIELAVHGDDVTCALPADSLRQILLNLMKNSADAMDGSTGTIDVDLRRQGAVALLTVGDTGPGYPEALIGNGIHAFQSGRADGTGLGLAVVQRLVKAAGGQLTLSRGETGGARTVVELPIEA